MNSAKPLGLVVISIVMTGFAGVQVRAGDAPPATFTKCAKACADCQLACDACFHHCTELTAAGAEGPALSLPPCFSFRVISPPSSHMLPAHVPPSPHASL